MGHVHLVYLETMPNKNVAQLAVETLVPDHVLVTCRYYQSQLLFSVKKVNSCCASVAVGGSVVVVDRSRCGAREAEPAEAKRARLES